MVKVARHKTAIARSQLSTPFQMLARHGFLDGEHSILDYGCGRGDDIAILRKAELPVRGWDPHYAPDTDLGDKADVVNLGFVVNVIENRDERAEALRKAYSLCRQCLSVAVMIAGRVKTEGMRPYLDGHVTKRGTFQKYFTQAEFLQFVKGVLGQEPVAVAPGVLFVFRDELAEQRFFRNRHRRQPRVAELLSIVSPQTVKRARSRQTVTQQYSDVLQGLWQKAIELGRLPAEDELDPDIGELVAKELGGVRRAAALARRAFGLSELQESESVRVEDLTVYFALEAFDQRPRYRELPIELQRDIKAFFGSYKKAAEAGKRLLFSLGTPDTVHEACKVAATQNLGYLEGDHSLQIQGLLLERLPAPLRVYAGCAEKLYGDIGTADLVKFHIKSGKLTLIYFDDFDGTPVPVMVERVKVKLRELDVDFFDYTRHDSPPLLYLKSRYMAPDHPEYDRQRAFDERLQSLEVFDFSAYGPDAKTFWRTLDECRLSVQGFDLVALD